MAATNVGVNAATVTLVADTAASIQLTGRAAGRKVRITHHGNNANGVYFLVGSTETSVAIAALAADEARVVPIAEWREVGAPAGDTWIGLRCAGTATVTCELLD